MKITIFGEVAGLKKLEEGVFQICLPYWRYTFSVGGDMNYKEFISLHKEEIENYFLSKGIDKYMKQFKVVEKEVAKLEELESRFKINEETSWLQKLFDKFF